jgi:hypothetical protein
LTAAVAASTGNFVLRFSPAIFGEFSPRPDRKLPAGYQPS